MWPPKPSDNSLVLLLGRMKLLLRLVLLLGGMKLLLRLVLLLLPVSDRLIAGVTITWIGDTPFPLCSSWMARLPFGTLT
jgi:hypothetical protein